MLKATRPFKDMITSFPKEPSLRIGRRVPDNAVNLAYYCNKTATDAEKVLTAEAPRNTIDHRIEEAYRYLFDQASDDDDLFPKYVLYKDEEGYSGRLKRMYVKWYPEPHIETKNVTCTKVQIVNDKNDVLKIVEYYDDDGFKGQMYLDATKYEVSKYKEVVTRDYLTRTVKDFELNYHEIYNAYVEPDNVDAWTTLPTNGTSQFPKQIEVLPSSIVAVGGTDKVASFVNSLSNPFDEAFGILTLDNIEYEPVFNTAPQTNSSKGGDISGSITVNCNTVDECRAICLDTYMSSLSSDNTTYDYSQINAFYTMWNANNPSSDGSYNIINSAISENKDIAIVISSLSQSKTGFGDSATSSFEVTYKYVIGNSYSEGTCKYNVTANYSGELDKIVETTKEVASEYTVTCSYTGLANKVWYDYDGMAYYRGAVTKGNAMGNINPDNNNEILMFSDKNGYLRRPVHITDENGITTIKNFYRVESDYVYLTDVFKDNTPCFYQYILKQPIYDYRGSDDNGFYEGNAVSVYTSTLKPIPSNYKYNMKLKVQAYETLTDKEIPKQYLATLFTSFISSSTDTYKITYNGYNSSNDDNIAIDNGISEDIYNYPYMIPNRDFTMEPVDSKTRVNKIKLKEPARIKDTRHYITFSYTITAENKATGKAFTTHKRTASILNKDYIVPAEYNKFKDRAMIISPYINGIQASPLDLILTDQANDRVTPILSYSNHNDFIFYATIIDIASKDRGGVNITVNPDGSGLILAETTIETGFWNDELKSYTKKLCIDNPYYLEDGYIYPGFMVKCIDTRLIKINAPREDGLLDSWYPMIQFGHYSQILDQYGTHIKVCYSMPEYDNQYYSIKYGKPYVDVELEPVTILNSHMLRTKCYPLYANVISQDSDTFMYKDKFYKVIKKSLSWKDAQLECKKMGGNLAMPKTKELSDFIVSFATKYNLNGLWLGATDEEKEGTWKWVDGTSITFNNWNTGEPNNVGGNEHYMEIYTSSGLWNDLPNNKTSAVNGFICELDRITDIKLYKKIDDELFLINIEDISFSDGIIITKDAISENDNILISYTYLEENYVYRGYFRTHDDFVRIDLNPNIYHTYNDDTYMPSEVKPSKNLFNKVIYFFLRPTIEYEIKADNDSLIFDIEDDSLIGDIILENKDYTLYHKIDDGQPNSDHDIYIGSVYIRQNTSLHSTIIVDSRTRGGGVISSMKDSLRKELEPESDYYLDIGYYDGEPYQENGVVIIRLDSKLLKEFGGRFTHGDIDAKVKRWLGFGVYPIIEYVDTYNKYQMPQYTLNVENSYTNVIDETPYIYLELIN